ncbi:lysophospholipid acyltransferase family protein [Pseudovibrio sp. SPO723]|uniref:lysophospholipid acyltransferase family protein n=1 Tax=Nesiotobacter zosterae TaxID=392721 RepID=UPI0029C4AF65|nr:lysophospholipid acyltransferase family protein [Pseudovibrio sp. SPO723]MDX5592015.1 lysophospholipid acyltransferase family protein [Pseudovibrio sp. SPO723]
MHSAKAIVVILLLTIATLIMIPLQWVAMKLDLKVQRKLPLVWHRIASTLMGIRVHQEGGAVDHRPLLITANHCSWLDIVVLGRTMPLSFIAKSEVAGWPIFGLFAKLQRTIFVNRSRRSDTGKVTREVADRMASGDAIVLFAEGTSSNGNQVLPFRSALIGAVHHAMGDGEGDKAWVQPLAISYTHLHGMPMGRFWRPHVAWYGDMELPGHLWMLLKEGGLDVHLTWGEPIPLVGTFNRKQLTSELENTVRAMMVGTLIGAENHDFVQTDANERIDFSSDEKKFKRDATDDMKAAS